MEHSFQVGDQVWLYINKDKMQGKGKKLKPIRYGPLKILEKIGENAFRLDLPTYMHIYLVINADSLRLFEPLLIEYTEEESQLLSTNDLLPKYINELQEDTVLDRKVRTTHRGDVEYLIIGLRDSKPSNAKWIEIGQPTRSNEDLRTKRVKRWPMETVHGAKWQLGSSNPEMEVVIDTRLEKIAGQNPSRRKSPE
eukprot:PITA_33337